MKVTVTECDGCGRHDTGTRGALFAAGWRRVTVWYQTAIGEPTSRSFDVCPDELCAARVVDLTRTSVVRPMSAQRESSRSGG